VEGVWGGLLSRGGLSIRLLHNARLGGLPVRRRMPSCPTSLRLLCNTVVLVSRLAFDRRYRISFQIRSGTITKYRGSASDRAQQRGATTLFSRFRRSNSLIQVSRAHGVWIGQRLATSLRDVAGLPSRDRLPNTAREKARVQAAHVASAGFSAASVTGRSV
jgi:hypothetical protein